MRLPAASRCAGIEAACKKQERLAIGIRRAGQSGHLDQFVTTDPHFLTIISIGIWKCCFRQPEQTENHPCVS